MGWFKFFIVLSAMYIAHGYYLFSNSHVEGFLDEHKQLMIHDPDSSCQNYSDKVMVEVKHRTLRGEVNLTGGKEQICDYLTQGQYATLAPNATRRVKQFDALRVDSGFPWRTATVEFDETAQMDVDNMGTIHSKTHETIILKRSLLGLKIIATTSTGGVRF